MYKMLFFKSCLFSSASWTKRKHKHREVIFLMKVLLPNFIMHCPLILGHIRNSHVKVVSSACFKSGSPIWTKEPRLIVASVDFRLWEVGSTPGKNDQDKKEPAKSKTVSESRAFNSRKICYEHQV